MTKAEAVRKAAEEMVRTCAEGSWRETEEMAALRAALALPEDAPRALRASPEPRPWVASCNEQSPWGPCDRPKGHDPAWMHCHGQHGWVAAAYEVRPASPPPEAPPAHCPRCLEKGRGRNPVKPNGIPPRREELWCSVCGWLEGDANRAPAPSAAPVVTGGEPAQKPGADWTAAPSAAEGARCPATDDGPVACSGAQCDLDAGHAGMHQARLENGTLEQWPAVPPSPGGEAPPCEDCWGTGREVSYGPQCCKPCGGTGRSPPTGGAAP